jgi:hypothetical protein
MLRRVRRGLAWGWLVLVIVGRSVGAAPGPSFGETATTLSESGQFVVTGPRTATRRPMETRRPGEKIRELTPQTLAVSCERVKDAVLGALEIPDRWRAGGGRTGKIFVGIDPTLRTNLPLAVEASVFEQGWQFRVAVPPRVTEDRLVRVMTQAVAMELASRGRGVAAGGTSVVVGGGPDPDRSDRGPGGCDSPAGNARNDRRAGGGRGWSGCGTG